MADPIVRHAKLLVIKIKQSNEKKIENTDACGRPILLRGT